MPLQNEKFPSSVAFDDISSALSNDADRKEAIKNGKAVFGFTLKNKDGEEDSWYIDLKETGKVSQEKPAKVDVTLLLSEEEFGKLAAGQANAQKLFMSGKLKIKGNVMKATAVEPIFKKIQTKAKI